MKEQAKEQCLYYLEIFTRTFYTKAKKEKRRKKNIKQNNKRKFKCSHFKTIDLQYSLFPLPSTK